MAGGVSLGPRISELVGVMELFLLERAWGRPSLPEHRQDHGRRQWLPGALVPALGPGYLLQAVLWPLGREVRKRHPTHKAPGAACVPHIRWRMQVQGCRDGSGPRRVQGQGWHRLHY